MDTLVSLLRLFRALLDWRVILDVILISAALFFLYRTLLRLGTWKIVTGIFLAMVIFIAANVLDLKGINWIYSNLSQVAVIALIVIFQPELRKIFEHASQYNVHPNMITKWKKEFVTGMPDIFSGEKKQQQKERQDKELIASLYQKIGKLEIELDWLRKKFRNNA